MLTSKQVSVSASAGPPEGTETAASTA
jgi:hypothetical protein